MAWNLEIHTIDVGQGESSLIVARDPDQAIAANRIRTMLIDGGEVINGLVINNYMQQQNVLGAAVALDHIIVTHYDEDHSMGIISLLEADNFYDICDTIAQIASVQAARGTASWERIALGAGAATAAFLGAYAVPGALDASGVAVDTGNDIIANDENIPFGDINAANYGIERAIFITNHTDDQLNAGLIGIRATRKRNEVCRAAGIAASNAITNGLNVAVAIRTAIFANLQSVITPYARFQTNGKYRNTNVIDTGDRTPGYLPHYARVVGGGILFSNDYYITAPRVNRDRNSVPDLASEILWNSGANPALPPLNAPSVFVMARNNYAWTRAAELGNAIDNNYDSIAIILKFNNFYFYTGGDLPTIGEDVIANAVRTTAIPNPAPGGAAFAVPAKITAFKCGHHGANTSTSQLFLGRANPDCAFISCGRNDYGHPAQLVINRLGASNISYFYLTGCYNPRDGIPFSQNPRQNQLTTAGNKSRVAGAVPLNQGNIILRINEAQSLAVPVIGPMQPDRGKQYTVTYYDIDTPNGNRTEVIRY